MKNWKTTVTGLVTGVGYIFLSYLQTGLKPKDAAIGTGIAILGLLAKDRNVTGGTIYQESSREALINKRIEENKR